MKPLLCVLMFCVVAGCGTAYYDKLYSDHLDELKRGERFSVLKGPTDIPNMGLVIRVPKIFANAYNKSSVHTADPRGEIDPERLNPPFLNPFPGLAGTYEVFQKDAADLSLPVYLYVGILAEGKAPIEAEVLGKLKALDPNAAWEAVSASTPEGGTVEWKKIDVKMPQEFFPEGHGKAGLLKMPGEFQLWWYDTPTGAVLLGWRAPESIAAQINFSTLAVLTAGTLRAKPAEAKPAEPAIPAADPAPDAAPDPAGAAN